MSLDSPVVATTSKPNLTLEITIFQGLKLAGTHSTHSDILCMNGYDFIYLTYFSSIKRAPQKTINCKIIYKNNNNNHNT